MPYVHYTVFSVMEICYNKKQSARKIDYTPGHIIDFVFTNYFWQITVAVNRM